MLHAVGDFKHELVVYLIWGLWFRVQGIGFRVWYIGLKVESNHSMKGLLAGSVLTTCIPLFYSFGFYRLLITCITSRPPIVMAESF